MSTVLRRRALEFRRGRSRRWSHPAFRLRHPGRAAEKVLAVRQDWAEQHPDVLARPDPGASARGRIHRAIRPIAPRSRASWRGRSGSAWRPSDPAHARRPSEGLSRRHHPRERPLSALVGRMAPRVPIQRRPHGCTRRWSAGGRRRSGPMRSEPPGRVQAGSLRRRPWPQGDARGRPGDAMGAFTGPAFQADDVAGYLASFSILRRPS